MKRRFFPPFLRECRGKSLTVLVPFRWLAVVYLARNSELGTFRMRFLPQQPPGGKIGHRQGTRLVLLRTLTVADSAQTCRRGSRSGGRRWANYSTDSKAIMQKSRCNRPCTNQNRRIARSQPKAGRPTESKGFLWRLCGGLCASAPPLLLPAAAPRPPPPRHLRSWY